MDILAQESDSTENKSNMLEVNVVTNGYLDDRDSGQPSLSTG